MPILLASLAVVAHTEQANQIYGVVFVVVLFSVVVRERSCRVSPSGSACR